MTERLPLFPLGTVLFPGLVLPLHIFEERYRALIHHLLHEAESSTFGVVAIQNGWEVATPGAGERPTGGHNSITLHDIGCTAELRQVTELPDGRFDIVTVGRRRFRVEDVHVGDAPFMVADVEWISEPEADDTAERLVPGLLDVFQRYLEVIRTDGHSGGEQLPDDPAVLSYLVAATAVLPLEERQRLLAAPTAADRLRLERRLLGREMALLRHVRALPVPLGELAVAPSPN
jgi:Lon protease-like protein